MADPRSVGGRAGVRVSVRRMTKQGSVPSIRSLSQWATLALGRYARGRELSVLLVGPARSRSLNRQYRGHDYPTNVLSFPVTSVTDESMPVSRSVPRPVSRTIAGPLLGDIVICPQVLKRESRAQGKSVRAHWMHLVIHGVLHLVGYDHQNPAAARLMEGRERRLLRDLGVADPYSE